MRSIVLTLVLAAAMVAGCSGTSRSPRTGGADANDAIITLDSDVRDAAVWVDGRYVAQLGSLKRGIALEPGTHRLEVRHDRYHTFYATIEVAARERRTVAVELAEELP